MDRLNSNASGRPSGRRAEQRRRTRLAVALVACGAFVASGAGPALADDVARTLLDDRGPLPRGGQVDVGQPPADQPTRAVPATGERADEIARLIKQLGDDDFKRRQAASTRLREVLADALAALADARKHADPEIASRADALIRQVSRRPSLFGRPGRAGSGAPLGQRVRVTVMNGSTQTEVFEGDQRIEITETPAGITVAVTGIENGKNQTERVSAATPAELRAKHPEAAALFERWGAGARNAAGPRIQVGPGGNGMRVFPGPLIIRGNAGARANAGAADDLARLRTRLRVAMVKAQLPPEQQRDVLKHLDELAELQAAGVAPAAQPADEQMRAYNEKSDALRKRLDELKLPDPGDVLPPPAKARLGVSLGGETPDGVIVGQVSAGSRGKRLGLLPLDVIRRVNDQPVTTAQELRKALTALDKPVVLHVRRNGKDMKLEEKPE